MFQLVNYNFVPVPPAESSMHGKRIPGHYPSTMETANEILLDENQHRLLICHRMAKALGKGEIFLDATGHKMRWRIEKDDRTTNLFYSIEEMELYLERLLENRYKSSRLELSYIDPRVRRRMSVINERHRSRTNGVPMTFHSRINTP